MNIREDILLAWLSTFRFNIELEGQWWWPRPVLQALVARGWVISELDEPGECGPTEITQLGEAQVGMFAPEMGIAPFEEMLN